MQTVLLKDMSRTAGIGLAQAAQRASVPHQLTDLGRIAFLLVRGYIYKNFSVAPAQLRGAYILDHLMITQILVEFSVSARIDICKLFSCQMSV